MRSLGMATVGAAHTAITAGARAIAERATPADGVKRHRRKITLHGIMQLPIQVAGVAAGVFAAWDTFGKGAGLLALAVGAFVIEYCMRPEDDKPKSEE